VVETRPASWERKRFDLTRMITGVNALERSDPLLHPHSRPRTGRTDLDRGREVIAPQFTRVASTTRPVNLEGLTVPRPATARFATEPRSEAGVDEKMATLAGKECGIERRALVQGRHHL